MGCFHDTYGNGSRISGKENGKLDPDGKITGADVLAVVDRINKVRSGETLEIWHNY
ncbi:hypothetical protein ABE099_12475 [Paenibacillus turicensis]|uniref:hypothetical protein n=1 Tax=Paenibacillus turicensis TaxID=160487 RepID=UPI003D2DDAD8